MIPFFAVIGIRPSGRHRFRLWIPLFILWLLLLPLVLVLLPIAFIVLAAVQVNPFRAIATGWQIMAGLRGTHVEVNDGSTHVLVKML
jgi:hypothetical protein